MAAEPVLQTSDFCTPPVRVAFRLRHPVGIYCVCRKLMSDGRSLRPSPLGLQSSWGSLCSIQKRTCGPSIDSLHGRNHLPASPTGGRAPLSFIRGPVIVPLISQNPLWRTDSPTRLRLQRLLADRFQLELRRESKPMPIYSLILGAHPRLDRRTRLSYKPEFGSGSEPLEIA